MDALTFDRIGRVALSRDHGGILSARFHALTSLRLFLAVVVAVLLLTGVTPASAQQPDDAIRTVAQAATNCVRLEIYVKNDCAACDSAAAELAKFAEKRKGVVVRTFNVDEDPKSAERLKSIADYFRVKDVTYPVIYGCNTFLQGFNEQKTVTGTLERMLTVTAYVRAGCPHCAAAKRFLPGLIRRYPAFRLVEYDVVQNAAALERMEQVVQRYRKSASSLPVIHLCNQLSIGYDTDSTTGRRLESILKYWTSSCPTDKKTSFHAPREPDPSTLLPYVRKDDLPSPVRLQRVSTKGGRPLWATFPVLTLFFYSGESADEPAAESDVAPPPVPGGDGPPLPLSGDSPVPPLTEGDHIEDDGFAPLPPGMDDEPPPPEGTDPPEATPHVPVSMDIPLFGQLSPRNLGMPAFTILVGLVDGFNPCAMWVLLFLLSLLVNLKSRTKILAVAGTFVVISGVAYFAFMAAWLNVFLLIGYLRPAQIVLGLLAVFVGGVHIKDFFAFKKGISLSIPEAAKPGIYARVRKIVMAENLWGAVAGATVLAVLVNVIELLCTAGLPAMYTEILSLQGYAAWKNYSMLALYNLAYMFDDSVMVGLVVITLGKRRLEERGGRWLKLISGALILLLGLVMIFEPELLI